MARYISFRIFLLCLIVCASMFMGGVWFEDKIVTHLYFQTAATLFILGLASFLIWFSLTLLEIHTVLKERYKPNL